MALEAGGLRPVGGAKNPLMIHVYHFLKANYALDDLRCRHLKISRITELNDPFEFLGVDLSDPTIRSGLKRWKQWLSEAHGLLCFSKTWRNPVLWGHYADNHRGICLGFDMPREYLSQVKYLPHRPPCPKALYEALRDGVPKDAAAAARWQSQAYEEIQHLLFEKFSHWSYEQEYRAFVGLGKSKDGLYFMDFSDKLKLRCVIVGDQSDVTRADVAGALNGIETKIEVFKARAGFRSFKVVRNKKESMWS